MKALLLLLTVFALTASAADISGKWKGTAEGPNGPVERSFTFQVNGSALTGETESEMMGKSVLTEGKVDGNNLSFTITGNLQGNEMKLAYKGTLSGDVIKLTVDFGGQSVEYTLKRVS